MAPRQPRQADWPAAAVSDHHIWRMLTSTTAPLLFDRIRRYSPYTLATRERVWGEFLVWLEAVGELHGNEAPGDRLTPDRLTRYSRERARRAAEAGKAHAPYTTYMHFLELYRVCRMFNPVGDYAWIRTHPLRPRGYLRYVKARRVPTVDIITLRSHLLTALEQALDGLDSSRSAASCRDLAICTLLSIFPLRLSNLTALTIGRHVFIDDHSVAILIPSRETKAGDGGALRLPTAFAASLKRYVELARPRLAGASSAKSLWMGRGRPFGRRGIQTAVRATMLRIAGHPLGPHAFRHLAARHLLRDLREGPTRVQAVLCHASPLTLDWYYPHGPSPGLDLWHSHLFGGSRRTPH